MSNTLVYSGVSKKTLAIIAITVGVLFVALIGIRYAAAVAPSDYGLHEGDTVSAAGSDDPDVYIVNDWGYKRLFLNPVIFGMYGHLGGFANVKSITPATRDAFGTSGLFRNCETNDQKVYGVETTGEDTGVLHWVNTTGAQAVADDANFFKKVFCINTNEFNWYAKSADYTSVSQVPSYARVPGQTPGVPGAITVSLASDNPGAASLTKTATGVTYLKVNLSGTGTLASLRIVRKGPGATADFGNVYLYDGATRLTSGRTPSSSDSSITYSGLNLAISGSKVLSVVADMVSTGATAGNVNYFAVDSAASVVLTSGTVGGSFPVNGSNFTVTGQTGGSVTVIKSGSLANPNVGSSNTEISEFKITANTEAAKVYRLTLINAGTIKYDQLSNLKLAVSGTTVATGVSTSGGYAIFDFGSSPYVIAKGDNRVFQMYADIGTGAKKAETINFYFEVSADVYTVGDQFGFGMLPSFDSTTGMNGSGSTKAHSLTLQGGVLTLSFIGPSATNVGTSTTKTHLLDFDMSSIANLEVRKTNIVLCHATNGSTYDDISVAASATAGFVDLNNVQVIDRDTGTAYVGPQDGTAFTTATTAGTSAAPYYTGNECASSKRGLAKVFTDVFTMNAGETKHLAIVADVKTANTGAGGVNFASGDQFKAVLYNYGTSVGTAGDLTILKYVGTNTGPYSVDVVPSSNLSGNTMTVQGSTLTLALAANPTAGNHNYVKGTKNVNAAGFSFSAALGNDVKITAVTLQGYADSTAAGGVITGNPGQLISAIRLIDGDTGAVVSSGPSTNNLSLASGTGAGQAVFNNLTWTIPGGQTKTLLAQVDLATNAAPTKNIFSFDIGATTDVTALDASSNTINLANKGVNGVGAATTYVTYNDAGTLAVAAASDNPTATAFYWGQTGTQFSKFKFTSTNEGFYIERLNLYDGAGSTTNIPNNIKSVSLTYTNQAGSSVTTVGQSFNSQASTSFAFSGDARPYVPKDGSMSVTVNANITPSADFFRTDGANFSIDLSVNPQSVATTNDEFRAIGEGSGTVKGTALTDLVGSTTKVAGNDMYVYRSFPQFTYIGTPATTIAVGQDVFKFSITAMGLATDGATVFFDGATIASPSLTVNGAASGSMRFAIIASGESTNALGLQLRRVVDSSGGTVDQLVASASGAVTDYHYGIQSLNNLTGAATNTIGSASFRFKDAATNQSIEIPAGSSNTFVLRLNTVTGYAKPYNSSSGRSADYMQVIMKTDQGNLVTWTDNGGANRNGSAKSVANILKSLPMNGTRINFQ